MASRETYIDPTAIVHVDAEIGAGVSIWNWTKVREHARIGENTNVGQGVYIDFGVTIGRGCKIQTPRTLHKTSSKSSLRNCEISITTQAIVFGAGCV